MSRPPEAGDDVVVYRGVLWKRTVSGAARPIACVPRLRIWRRREMLLTNRCLSWWPLVPQIHGAAAQVCCSPTPLRSRGTPSPPIPCGPHGWTGTALIQAPRTLR